MAWRIVDYPGKLQVVDEDCSVRFNVDYNEETNVLKDLTDLIDCYNDSKESEGSQPIESQLYLLKQREFPFLVTISTFAPESFEVVKSFNVTVIPYDNIEDGYKASFFDANIHVSSGTTPDVINKMKDEILCEFERLENYPDQMLGPIPLKTKYALLSLIKRIP